MPQQITVTGGAGFIGSRLVGMLRSEGINAISLDIIQDNNGGEFTKKADVLDLVSLEQAITGSDTVFHMAGYVQGQAKRNPYASWLLQIQGTLNVLRAAKNASVRRLILASSYYVYLGAPPELAIVDEATPLNIERTDLFGGSKLLSEQLAQDFSRRFDLEVICLRMGSVFGAGASTNIVGTFMNAGLQHEPVEIWGSGDRVHQLTYLEDIVQACAHVLNAPQGIYNLISPEQMTTKELAITCSNMFGLQVSFDSSKAEGPSFPHVSPYKSIQVLGWKPTPLAEALLATWSEVSSKGGSL